MVVAPIRAATVREWSLAQENVRRSRTGELAKRRPATAPLSRRHSDCNKLSIDCFMRESKVVPKTPTKTKRREMKVRVPQTSRAARFLLGRFGRVLIASFALLIILSAGAFAYFYSKYARMFDEKLRAGLFANAAKIFAEPESVAVGDASTPSDIANQLRRSGYTESRSNPIGYYEIEPSAIQIFPAPIPTSSRKPASSNLPAGASPPSFPCRTTRRGRNTSWSRSSSPTSPAPAARSGAS